MSILQRLGAAFGRGTGAAKPQAAFFKNERAPIMVGWNPPLNEARRDIQVAWAKSAARAIESIQNSGFLARAVTVSTGAIVGSGLRVAARPDAEALGWTQEDASAWGREVEAKFREWATNPVECDASGQMTLAQMQQLCIASYLAYGEVLALFPLLRRPGAVSRTKIAMLPPSRIVDHSVRLGDVHWVQGVRVDYWGFPLTYRLREEHPTFGWRDLDIAAMDRDGRRNVLLLKDPVLAATRGISPLAAVLKVARQVDQYADATLTSALLQTIFAATLKTNISGLAAFDGMMTSGDTGALDLSEYAAAKGEWYQGAKIDLTQHGRIAQLFPNDELEFNQATHPGQEYDKFTAWLLREIAAGAGLMYESMTGDFRGATYSSIQMGGAIEWQTTSLRRENFPVAFTRAAYETWLEEQIGVGRIRFPGGLPAFLNNKSAATRASFTGPPRPQADELKTAKAYEVRAGMQATTLMEIAENYGRDWEDDMRQRAAENALADELDLPRPWAMKDPMEKPEGEDMALDPPEPARPAQ